jgi:hypothetical protein
MKLALTQRYAMCAFNQDGVIDRANLDAQGAFLACALYELESDGFIAIEENTLRPKKELTKEFDYLRPLYSYIKQHQEAKFQTLAKMFLEGEIDYKPFVVALCQPLVAEDAMTYDKDKDEYIPNVEVVRQEVDALAGRIDGDDDVTRDDAALLTFIIGGGLTDKVFGRSERRHIDEFFQNERNQALKDVHTHIEDTFAPLVRDFVTGH